MAGRIIPAVRATVTAGTAAGFLTVTSATGLYVGARCWLTTSSNTLPIYVEIVNISGTTVGVRRVRRSAEEKGFPTYGYTDVSAYNAGGFLDQEDQFIYNRTDAPAP